MSEKVKYYEADELREAFEEKIHFLPDLTEWDVHETLDTVPVHEINGETSDGYHTFNELYHHRAVLFSVVCGMFPSRAWKSKLHDNGTMFDGMFIVGIETPEGQATYHYDVEPYWDMFDVKELERAPKWDGHTAAQAIERIGSLRVFGGAFGWETEEMRGLFEMCLMRRLIQSASREDGRKRKKADGRKLVCAVCRTYGGTMYKRGNGYVCRDCLRKEGKK